MAYDLMNATFGVAIRPVDNNGTATVGVAFDTQAGGGIGLATLVVVTGNQAGTTSLFSITECDTIGGSYTDITKNYYKLGSSLTEQTSPSTFSFTALGTSDDNKVFVAHIPTAGRKRFFKVNITHSAAAALVGGVWIGTRTGQSPTTVTEASADLTGGAGSAACVGEILIGT